MRLICLLSGGIDSPVAAYLMGARGADLVMLHMDNVTGGGEELEKVVEITHVLERSLGCELPLHHAPHHIIQERVADLCDRGLQCVLCKRFMLRTADFLSQRLGALGVVTGDSLGQVASQTLRNIHSVEHGLDLTVLRPLIGLDKLEIEQMAKSIGTYGISVRSSVVCPFLPSRPRTRASVDQVLREEERLPVHDLLQELVEGIERINP